MNFVWSLRESVISLILKQCQSISEQPDEFNLIESWINEAFLELI